MTAAPIARISEGWCPVERHGRLDPDHPKIAVTVTLAPTYHTDPQQLGAWCPQCEAWWNYGDPGPDSLTVHAIRPDGQIGGGFTNRYILENTGNLDNLILASCLELARGYSASLPSTVETPQEGARP